MTANDGNGGTTVQNLAITVTGVDEPPTISNVTDQSTTEDTPIANIAVMVADHETAAGSLTVTATSSNPALFPSGSISIAGSGASRTLSLTPAANQSGTATITVTVTDAGGLTATDTFVVTVSAVNDPPVAQSGTLGAASVGSTAGVLVGSDVDSSLLTYAIATQPSKGTVAITDSNTGAYTYTANVGATGSDSFTFTVSDGVATSSPATINVAISPSPANSVVKGGNDLVVTGTPGSDMVTVLSLGGGVQVLLNGRMYGPFQVPGRLVVNAGDSRDFIITAGFNGPTAVNAGAGDDYVLTGGGNDLVVGGPGNDILFVGRGSNVVWGDDEGQLHNSPGAGNDFIISLDGHDQIYAGGGNDTVYAGAGNDTIHAGDGDDLVFADAGDDTVRGGNGSDRLFGGLGNNVIIADEPGNAPTISDVPDQTMSEDTTLFAIPVTVGDVETPLSALRMLAIADNTVLFPAGSITIDGTSGNRSISLRPALNQSGTTTITLTVIDGTGLAATDTFTVTVSPVNDAPVAASGNLIVIDGQPASGTLAATDPDGDSLEYSLATLPSKGVVTITNSSTGAYVYTPNPGTSGVDTFQFVASDGLLTSNLGTITVNAASDGQPNSVVLLANDLYIYGSPGSDTVTILPTGGRVMVILNGWTMGPYTVAGHLVIETGDSADVINTSLWSGPTRIDGGGGNDTIITGSGDDVVIGGAGSDQITAGDGHNIIWGDAEGAIESSFGAAADTIVTLGGNDQIFGGGGNDTINSGAGNDFIHAGDGNDVVLAGSGDDIVRGGRGDDQIYGGAGNDIILGNEGNDLLYGEAGSDLVAGGTGRDVIFDTDFDVDILIDSVLAQDAYTGATSPSDSRSTSDLALQAILGEWLRGAGSLAQRAQRIRTGGGLNGTNTLVAVGDDEQDTVSSSVLSTDWLFAEQGLDRITRQAGDLFDGT